MIRSLILKKHTVFEVVAVEVRFAAQLHAGGFEGLAQSCPHLQVPALEATNMVIRKKVQQ